ncbi:MAG TPA: hypothetical protein V6C97_00435 [Oculatellaceae cyanobacterium]
MGSETWLCEDQVKMDLGCKRFDYCANRSAIARMLIAAMILEIWENTFGMKPKETFQRRGEEKEQNESKSKLPDATLTDRPNGLTRSETYNGMRRAQYMSSPRIESEGRDAASKTTAKGCERGAEEVKSLESKLDTLCVQLSDASPDLAVVALSELLDTAMALAKKRRFALNIISGIPKLHTLYVGKILAPIR